jgi:hypothetical protein
MQCNETFIHHSYSIVCIGSLMSSVPEKSPVQILRNYIRCNIPQSVILCQFKIPGPITQYSQNVVFKKKFINNVTVLECTAVPCINQIRNESDVSGTYSSTNLPILIITITIVTVCAKCHHVSQVWNVS